MVTDEQVRRLRRMVQTEKRKAVAAAKAGMDVKTARKYLRNGKLPSQVKPEHTWRTRTDPFEEVWEEVVELLKTNGKLEAKTIFEWLQRKYPGWMVRYGLCNGRYGSGGRWKGRRRKCISLRSIIPGN